MSNPKKHRNIDSIHIFLGLCLVINDIRLKLYTIYTFG